MEDVDAVIPLRPGFDIQVRGFNRNQVMEHVELLEDQLKLVTIDRNEAAQLNSDLRQLCDDARHDLSEAEARLRNIESSDTGLPAASQRVQNMLSIAEEEVQTLRDRAKRQAEVIRGSAENEARELLGEAERAADEIRTDCAQLLTEMEERRDQIRREHAQSLRDLRERDQRMRQSVRDAYKRAMEVAQQESDQMLVQTRQQCAEWDAETEQRRLNAFDEIRAQHANVEELRSAVLSAMDKVRESVDSSSTVLQAPRPEPTEALIPEPHPHAIQLPSPRENVQTFTFPLDEHNPNGTTPQPDTHDVVQRN